MLFIIDLDNGRLLDAYLQTFTEAAFRYRSDAAIELMFRRGGAYVEPTGVGLVFTIKTAGKFEEDPPLVITTVFAKTGDGATAKWTGYAPIYGSAIESKLEVDGNDANDVAAFPAMAEVYYQIDGATNGTRLPYFTANISNSLYAGTESTPTLPPPNGQAPTFLPAVTALTGGTATDLDGQVTSGVSVPRLYLVVIGGLARYFRLKTKEAEVVDGTNVIEPLDYDEDTNDKVFVRAYDDVSAIVQRASEANAAGNTTITFPAGCRVYTVDLVVTGVARTSVLALATTGLTGGEILRLDYTLPATAAIVLEVRNATTGGTLLDTLTTDASGDSAFIELTYSGTVWQFNRAQYPAN